MDFGAICQDMQLRFAVVLGNGGAKGGVALKSIVRQFSDILSFKPLRYPRSTFYQRQIPL